MEYTDPLNYLLMIMEHQYHSMYFLNDFITDKRAKKIDSKSKIYTLGFFPHWISLWASLN